MNANEYVRVLRRVGLSDMDACLLFGHSVSAQRSWTLGGTRVPTLVCLVLRLVDAGKLDLETLEAMSKRERRARVLKSDDGYAQSAETG